MTRSFDVVVVGLGIMGASAVHHLARRGVKVLGLDARGPGHELGSSHGDTRIYRRAYWEGERYVPLLTRSYDAWRELDAASPARILMETGGVFVGAPSSDLVARCRETAAACGVPHERLDAGAIRARFPAFRVPDGATAVFEPDAFMLFAEGSRAALLASAVSAGARLRYGAEVAAIEPSSGGGAEVVTDGERIACARVVVAAGPWIAGLVPELAGVARPQRMPVYWLEVASDRGRDFRPGALPVFLWEDTDGAVLYGFPEWRFQGGLKIGFHNRQLSDLDLGEPARPVGAGEIAEVQARAARAFGLAPGGARGITCVYTMTPDTSFVIDRSRASPDVVYASACSGHGFKFAPAIGEALADLATGAAPKVDLAPFARSRFDPAGERIDGAAIASGGAPSGRRGGARLDSLGSPRTHDGGHMTATETEEFDAVVVGAGQAGPSLAASLAGAGRKVALVEKRRLGGTCVNDGCIPTKTLVASARAAWTVANAARWGVTIGGGFSVDMRAVKARKDAVVQESRDSLSSWLGPMPNLTLVHGHARFVDEHILDVAGRRIYGREIFLNTGARPVVPDVPGIGDVPVLTNTEMMDIDALPEHLVILGGSYVGLEFAQMYRRFGSRVTVIERGAQIIPRDDADVAAAVSGVLRGEGIDLRTEAKVERIEARGGGVRVITSQGAIDGSHLLAAVGRRPNSDDLGLEHAGVPRDERGYITVDDELRTLVPHIYALGDVNGHGAFTHTSYNDFEIVEANLLHGGRRRVSDRIPIYGLYVDPPLGRVGMTEREARGTGKNVVKGTRPMTRVGRARERGETAGFLKILVDGDTKRILGAALFGVEGDEAVHTIADVMYANAPYTVLREAVHAHPTVSELLPTVLGDLRPIDA